MAGGARAERDDFVGLAVQYWRNPGQVRAALIVAMPVAGATLKVFEDDGSTSIETGVPQAAAGGVGGTWVMP